jgi:hypothetical protein
MVAVPPSRSGNGDHGNRASLVALADASRARSCSGSRSAGAVGATRASRLPSRFYGLLRDVSPAPRRVLLCQRCGRMASLLGHAKRSATRRSLRPRIGARRASSQAQPTRLKRSAAASGSRSSASTESGATMATRQRQGLTDAAIKPDQAATAAIAAARSIGASTK